MSDPNYCASNRGRALSILPNQYTIKKGKNMKMLPNPIVLEPHPELTLLIILPTPKLSNGPFYEKVIDES